MADAPMISPLQQLRDGMALIREAVEEHMPIGVLPSHDHTGIEPLEEVEAIVRAIHEIADRPTRRVLRFVSNPERPSELQAISGRICVGRIYPTGGYLTDPKAMKYTWSLSGNFPFQNQGGRTPTMEQAKDELLKAWKAWVAAVAL